MRIALVAHDNKKKDLQEWCKFNEHTLSGHILYATHGTGKLISESIVLLSNINILSDGARGGDMQTGAMIANGELDCLIFFWDPLTAQPHDVDVKALLRIAVLYNVPIACNRRTADMLISSELFK